MSVAPQHTEAFTKPPTPATGRFSLERLSSAFARLMGDVSTPTTQPPPQIAIEDDGQLVGSTDDGGHVTPRMIVEGLLFVGAEDGRRLGSDELAAPIRNATPAEIDRLVAELNAAYQADESAYEIVSDAAGHRLQLREAFHPVRERLRGQVRAAKLTPAALEVLAVVAYRQGVTAEEINRLRGVQSYAVLAQLVRRGLVSIQRAAAAPKTARYTTTDRFNRLFGVASPADLPQNADLDDL